ncbi:MAG TPA: hypothetical protein VGC65_10360 [Bacteroidia bacterium]
MATLAHIINPVNAPKNRELMIAQSFVFESLKRAKATAKCGDEVKLYTTQYPEDHAIIPNHFTILPDLKRSIQNIKAFSDVRKLPLLKDLLESVYVNSSAEYLIYSNADIILMPFFYDSVQQIIAEGYDAFIINRRRISAKYETIDQLDLMYSEIGKDHLGYDCFVFRRELFPKFILANVCIGIPHAGNDLAHNLFCFPRKFKLFTQKHLTFHVGMELHRNWGKADITAHNKSEFLAVVKLLQPYYKIEFIPGSNLNFFKRHFKWLMNFTFHYPTMMKIDFQQRKVNRPERESAERGNSKNRYLDRLIRWVNFD